MPLDYAVSGDGGLLLNPPEYIDYETGNYSLTWSGGLGFIEHFFNDLGSAGTMHSEMMAISAGKAELRYVEMTLSGSTVLLTKTVQAFGAGWYNYNSAPATNGIADISSFASGGTAWSGDSSDLLIGSKGADSLYGGGGDDRLRGGDGSDLLDGGAGADRMQGGAGEDMFILRRGEIGTRAAGMDHIIDFEGAGVEGGDIIRFDGFDRTSATISYLGTFGGAQRYAVGDATHSEEFMLQSTNGAHLSINDVLFVEGNGVGFLTDAFYRPAEYHLV